MPMIQAPGSAPLNAGIVHDLTRLNEVLLGDWPAQPPEHIEGAKRLTWWRAVHLLHGTGPENYFEQRALLCRLYVDVIQMRMFGPLRDNATFERALAQLGSAHGRAQFMREALSNGFHAATLDEALGRDNPQPERSVEPLAVPRRRENIQLPSTRTPLAELLHTLRISMNDQLAHEIEELSLVEGCEVHAYDWGMVLDSTYTKMVFCWDLMCSLELGLAQRLFTDWALYGEREPRLQALRNTLSDGGTPLDLHCSTSDVRTVFIQFEVVSSLPAAQEFGRWFHEVGSPRFQCNK